MHYRCCRSHDKPQSMRLTSFLSTLPERQTSSGRTNERMTKPVIVSANRRRALETSFVIPGLDTEFSSSNPVCLIPAVANPNPPGFVLCFSLLFSNVWIPGARCSRPGPSLISRVSLGPGPVSSRLSKHDGFITAVECSDVRWLSGVGIIQAAHNKMGQIIFLGRTPRNYPLIDHHLRRTRLSASTATR